MAALLVYLKQLVGKSPTRIISALEIENLKEHSSYWTSCCPVHNGDNDRAFLLMKESLNWRCHTHSCHGNRSMGDVFSLVQGIRNCDFPQAVEFVKRVYEIGEVDEGILDKIEFEESLRSMSGACKSRELNASLPRELIDFYRSFENDYYEKRGYARATLNRFGVGFCPREIVVPHDLIPYVFVEEKMSRPFFSDRAVIPILDSVGNLVGFTGRSVKNAEPKFLHTLGLRKDLILYNWNSACKYAEVLKEVIVCESTGVAWRWFEAGYPNVVAAMGAGLSTAQVKILTNNNFVDRVILAYDCDEAGRSGSALAAEKLRGKTKIYKIELPSGQDYDTMRPDEVRSWYNKREIIN